jgi:hypothetical protein
MLMPRFDWTGKRFGKLTVEKFGYQVQRKNFWECRCDCGNTLTVRASFLKSGLIQSCGCSVGQVVTKPEEPPAITVGEKVLFDPFETLTGFGSEDNRGEIVRGIVVLVNNAHKWFSVEYSCGGVKQKTSFKFSQIGKDVRTYG